MIDAFVLLLKYIFAATLAVEGVLILRALYALAREKARATATTPAPAEE